MYKDVFDLLQTEKSNYETSTIPIADNYEWSMYEHINKTVLYKNSQFTKGKDDNKPFKNITRPILNLQYRAEGFDVKDIELFVDDVNQYYKSFLIRKFHDKWARQNDIDTFIDEMVESYIDFGGALVKDVNDVRPEVVPLQRLAFCDQTDILSGPICERHYYSPEELREAAGKGWKNIDKVIILAQNTKRVSKSGREVNTPGKYIEIFEIHGCFPTKWLDENYEETDSYESDYTQQMWIVTEYTDKEENKQGIVLFKGKEAEIPYKLILRDKIQGRALGLGGAEELFQPQIWVNYGVIRIKGMLDQASKIIYQTTDPAFANRNNTENAENGEIFVLEDGKQINQIDTRPINMQAFENLIVEWENHAQQMGGAQDPIMGDAPKSGTPFRLQELVTREAHSLHEYRKGKLATFLDEIYRDWIIPYIVSEINKGQEWMAELSIEELQGISETVVNNVIDQQMVEVVLSGKNPEPGEKEALKQSLHLEFMKKGKDRFLEIFRGEMKTAPIDVRVNIAGKQKDLAGQVDKLTNVFRQVIAAPQVLQSPYMAKLFNQILEKSGLDPMDFTGFVAPPPPTPAPAEMSAAISQ